MTDNTTCPCCQAKKLVPHSGPCPRCNELIRSCKGLSIEALQLIMTEATGAKEAVQDIKRERLTKKAMEEVHGMIAVLYHKLIEEKIPPDHVLVLVSGVMRDFIQMQGTMAIASMFGPPSK